jgi:hypothetical protein
MALETLRIAREVTGVPARTLRRDPSAKAG